MATTESTQVGIQLHNQVKFSSIGRTGTGAGETIPHGLGVTPTMVHLQCRASTTAWTITSFDNTNIEASDGPGRGASSALKMDHRRRHPKSVRDGLASASPRSANRRKFDLIVKLNADLS